MLKTSGCFITPSLGAERQKMKKILKEIELAYMAGFFDGEGCILIEKQKNKIKKRPYYHVSIQMAQAEKGKEIPMWFQANFGGHLIHSRRSLKNPNLCDIWQWRATCQNAMRCLEIIYPYLILKKPQIDLAFKLQSGKQTIHRCSKYHIRSEAELAIEEAEYLLMKNLNKKGSSISPGAEEKEKSESIRVTNTD